MEEGKVVIVPISEGGSNSEGFLLGYVERAYDSMSVVKTIFDTTWTSAVRIKKDGLDALLSGGLNPSLTLIPSSARIAPGDRVYNADSRFPYGMILGEVKSLGSHSEQTLQSAVLAPGFDLNAVRTVLILK